MEVNISLRKIDQDNWRECIALKVKDEQSRFVATNENALALAYVHTEMNPLGIYLDEKMVGFLMHALDPDDNLYYINRLMVDENYQGRGYGKAALKLLIGELKNEGVKSLDILHKPDNYSAIKLYRSLGFEQTNIKVGDEDVSTLVISAN